MKYPQIRNNIINKQSGGKNRKTGQSEYSGDFIRTDEIEKNIELTEEPGIS